MNSLEPLLDEFFSESDDETPLTEENEYLLATALELAYNEYNKYKRLNKLK